MSCWVSVWSGAWKEVLEHSLERAQDGRVVERDGYDTDASDKKLLANRWYEAVSRRAGQKLQPFFCNNKKHCLCLEGLSMMIGPIHMLIRSGLSDDQINDVYGLVMRFFDKPGDVDRHRNVQSVTGRYSQTLQGVQLLARRSHLERVLRKG